jgi:hypothetical protein
MPGPRARGFFAQLLAPFAQTSYADVVKPWLKVGKAVTVISSSGWAVVRG